MRSTSAIRLKQILHPIRPTARYFITAKITNLENKLPYSNVLSSGIPVRSYLKTTPSLSGRHTLAKVLRFLSTMPSEPDSRAPARGGHIKEQASVRQDSENDSSNGEEKKPMRLRDVSRLSKCRSVVMSANRTTDYGCVL